MERQADWTFVKLGTARWVWRHTSAEGMRRCPTAFSTLRECIADAALHGYDSKTSLAHVSGPLGPDDARALSRT